MVRRIPGMIITVILLTAFFSPSLWGLEPNLPVSRYMVESWGSEKGLESNIIVSITQTPDGYLWLATTPGLIRFDGEGFLRIPFAGEKHTGGKKTVEPNYLFTDSTGIMWVGSSAGVFSYDYRTRAFKLHKNLARDRVRRIQEDMSGNLWISFFSSYVNRLSGNKVTKFNETHGLTEKKINPIVEDRYGNLFFCGRERGIFKFTEGRFVEQAFQGVENAPIVDMCEAADGTFWLATNYGLYRLDLEEKKVTKFTVENGMSDNYVTTVREDAAGNLWLGTNKGVNRATRQADGSVTFEGVLEEFKIISLYEDREENLWVGTLNNGLKMLKNARFFSYEAAAEAEREDVLSLYQDSRGDVWMGTLAGKLFHYRGARFIEAIGPDHWQGFWISAIAEDNDGNLWIGTNGKGAFRKTNNGWRHFGRDEGLADNMVNSIFTDSRGDIWFATLDGVSVLRRRTNAIESFNAAAGLSGKAVNNVFQVRNGDIWLAADKGVTVLEKGRTNTPNPAVYLENDWVVCIYEDPAPSETEGAVYWAATYENGLKRFRLKDGHTVAYTTAEGMATNCVTWIFEAQEGVFWLTGNHGVLRISKSQLNLLARKELEEINCIAYGICDGLKSLELNNEFSRNAVLKTGEGQLWLNTKKGVSILEPERILLNKKAPPVVIEAVSFGGQSERLHREGQNYVYELEGHEDFSARFAAPTFVSQEKLRYRYRLENWDEAWRMLSAGQERRAHYRGLEPGTYTFRVSACNADGVWNREGKALTFTLMAPSFTRWWWGALLLLLLLGSLASVYYFYKGRHFVEDENAAKAARYKNSNLNEGFVESCIEKLKQRMESDKLYCDTDISLQTLADELSITPHQLSQILNENLNRSFPDYINSHRIEEVKKILDSPRGSEQKIAALAYDVGFNTMTAFYKAFRKYTGMTPGQYRNGTAKKERQ